MELHYSYIVDRNYLLSWPNSYSFFPKYISKTVKFSFPLYHLFFFLFILSISLKHYNENDNSCSLV